MSSKEKKGKNSKEAPKAAENLPEPAKYSPPPAEEMKESLNEEEDVDLSSLEVASTISDENFLLNGPKLILSDNVNESYKDILSACSSTAHDIKQSIHDVLNSRDRVVITEVDPTEELQESLSKRIADFAQVVGSSFAPQKVSSETLAEKDPKEKSPEAQTPETSSSTEVEPQQPSIAIKDSDAETKKADPVVSEQDNKVPPQPQEALDSLKEVLKSATPPVEEDKISKKQKNGASKKKEDNSLDQILKSLGNGKDEEKLRVMGKKYMEALEKLKDNEPKLKQLERQVVAQQRDKELIQAENNRLILAKSRLEGLCMELQKKNKIIREDAIRLKLEEEKRKEIATKFQVTLTDISGLAKEYSPAMELARPGASTKGTSKEASKEKPHLSEKGELWAQAKMGFLRKRNVIKRI